MLPFGYACTPYIQPPRHIDILYNKGRFDTMQRLMHTRGAEGLTGLRTPEP